MNEINVRIKHKYDQYSNWLTSEIVLEAGELAIAEIPSQQTFEEPDGSTVLTPPAIGVKVGDGSHTFKELPWIQSTAGDVYAWAKEAEKPIYTAEEIENLEDYIAGKVEDTNTSYQFVYENDVLYIYELNLGQEIPSTPTYELPITVSTKVDKVEAVGDIEGNVVELTEDGNIRDSGKKLDEFLSKVEAEQDYVSLTTYGVMEETVSDINERLITAEGQVEELITSVDILNGDGEGSVQKQVADAVAAIVDNAPENFDTLKEIADFIISEEDNGAAGLINRVGALESELTTLQETTIKDLTDLSHTHDNKDILDAITQDDIDKWNNSGSESDITDIQDRLTIVEGTIGDETAGLMKDVSDNTERLNSLEETVSSNTEAVTSAVQTISILGMNEEDEAVTKVGTNVEINKIPVSILVNDLTLILNCGNATEVI